MSGVSARLAAALMAALFGSWTCALHASSQSLDADIRLVGFTIAPLEPEFGEVFDLQLNLRMAPGTVVFLPDTLVPGPASVSAGPGQWSEAQGPADSVDISAHYPVMGFLDGRVELPSLEVWTRIAVEGEEAGPRSVAEIPDQGPASGDLLRSVLISTGAVQVVPLAEMANAEGPISPRPPADVLGGQWSPWLISAMFVSLIAGAGILWVAGSAIRARKAVPVRAPLVPWLSPQDEALAELDRILARGWHLEGSRERLVEFYESSTGVLRRLAEQFDRQWGMSLTSNELLAALRDRWGDDSVVRLREAVSVAEWVKFGRHHPGSDLAEAHWKTIRDWVASPPKDR